MHMLNGEGGGRRKASWGIPCLAGNFQLEKARASLTAHGFAYRSDFHPHPHPSPCVLPPRPCFPPGEEEGLTEAIESAYFDYFDLQARLSETPFFHDRFDAASRVEELHVPHTRKKERKKDEEEG